MNQFEEDKGWCLFELICSQCCLCAVLKTLIQKLEWTFGKEINVSSFNSQSQEPRLTCELESSQENFLWPCAFWHRDCRGQYLKVGRDSPRSQLLISAERGDPSNSFTHVKDAKKTAARPPPQEFQDTYLSFTPKSKIRRICIVLKTHNFCVENWPTHSIHILSA